MKPSQREMEKKNVANLQNKADFLKNPRFCDTPKYLINGNMKDADRYGSFYDKGLSPKKLKKLNQGAWNICLYNYEN